MATMRAAPRRQSATWLGRITLRLAGIGICASLWATLLNGLAAERHAPRIAANAPAWMWEGMGERERLEADHPAWRAQIITPSGLP